MNSIKGTTIVLDLNNTMRHFIMLKLISVRWYTGALYIRTWQLIWHHLVSCFHLMKNQVSYLDSEKTPSKIITLNVLYHSWNALILVVLFFCFIFIFIFLFWKKLFLSLAFKPLGISFLCMEWIWEHFILNV